ncbi:MAG TPA: OsmC family protein [Tepidisphaeraceae bacterium]|nr:OsmC family protein [Tepidisphaeraceae bacterium]
MPTSTAQAVWTGNLTDGTGTISTASGALSAPYGYKSRFESGPGTNPEELIGAAHAGCFSMALAHILSSGGHTPRRIQTTAKVKLDKVGEGFVISSITLDCLASVPGIDDQKFQAQAAIAKSGCPVSKALSATPITLNAKLE